MSTVKKRSYNFIYIQKYFIFISEIVKIFISEIVKIFNSKF